MVVISCYLRREVYTTTALVAGGFPGLLARFDVIGEIEDMGTGSYSLRETFVCGLRHLIWPC